MDRVATEWRGTHQRLVDALKKSRGPGLEQPPHQTLKGKYWRESRAFYLEVLQDDGMLKLISTASRSRCASYHTTAVTYSSSYHLPRLHQPHRDSASEWLDCRGHGQLPNCLR